MSTKASTYFSELIDPKKKNARVLAPLNRNVNGPWFFFAKTVSRSTGTKKKQVILAIAHDGIKFVQCDSTDKIECDSIEAELYDAPRYRWYNITSYTITPGTETFRFVWRDKAAASKSNDPPDEPALQTTTPRKRFYDTTFAFQLMEWDQIEPLIEKIMADLKNDRAPSRLSRFGFDKWQKRPSAKVVWASANASRDQTSLENTRIIIPANTLAAEKGDTELEDSVESDTQVVSPKRRKSKRITRSIEPGLLTPSSSSFSLPGSPTRADSPDTTSPHSATTLRVRRVAISSGEGVTSPKPPLRSAKSSPSHLDGRIMPVAKLSFEDMHLKTVTVKARAPASASSDSGSGSSRSTSSSSKSSTPKKSNKSDSDSEAPKDKKKKKNEKKNKKKQKETESQSRPESHKRSHRKHSTDKKRHKRHSSKDVVVLEEPEAPSLRAEENPIQISVSPTHADTLSGAPTTGNNDATLKNPNQDQQVVDSGVLPSESTEASSSSSDSVEPTVLSAEDIQPDPEKQDSLTAEAAPLVPEPPKDETVATTPEQIEEPAEPVEAMHQEQNSKSVPDEPVDEPQNEHPEEHHAPPREVDYTFASNSETGPWFFKGRSILSAQNVKRQNVVLAVAHDGFKFVEVPAATWPTLEDASSLQAAFYRAGLYAWVDIKTFNLIKISKTVKFNWTNPTNDAVCVVGFQCDPFHILQERLSQVMDDLEKNEIKSEIFELGFEKWEEEESAAEEAALAALKAKRPPTAPSAHLLDPLNNFQLGPFFFFAKTVLSATNTKRQDVILALAHDGIKYIEVHSVDPIDIPEIESTFHASQLYTWSDITSYSIMPMVHTFKFTCESHQGGDGAHTFGFQSPDWLEIQERVTQITAEIDAGCAPSSLESFGAERWHERAAAAEAAAAAAAASASTESSIRRMASRSSSLLGIRLSS